MSILGCGYFAQRQAKLIVNLNLNSQEWKPADGKDTECKLCQHCGFKSGTSVKVSPGFQMQENNFMQPNMLLHAGLHIEKVRLFCRL